MVRILKIYKHKKLLRQYRFFFSFLSASRRLATPGFKAALFPTTLIYTVNFDVLRQMDFTTVKQITNERGKE